MPAKAARDRRPASRREARRLENGLPLAINPASLAPPSGYSNGILCPQRRRLLFISGQIAWDRDGRIVGGKRFAPQFACALSNVVEVVRAAGGAPTDIAEITIFVTDRRAYVESLKPLGAAYRSIMGRHYPAMTLVVVSALLEPEALVEMRAVATLPLPKRPLRS